MKIVYLSKLREFAERLGLVLGIRTQRTLPAGRQVKNARTQDGEEKLFVGRGLANKYLKRLKKYPKTWELGSVADSFDYLVRVILNEKEVETHKRRSCPEKIIVQKYDYDCGGAAVCTLLLMLKREDVLKTDVYSRLEVNPADGTRSINIKRLFEEEKIPYIEIWSAGINDLESIVSAGGVALISYQAEGTDEEVEKLECGHYSIVFDIDSENVWLIDPSYDEEYLTGYGKGVFSLPRERFDKLWIDKGVEGEIYNKWLLAVRL